MPAPLPGFISQRPKVTVVICVLLILSAILYAFWSVLQGGPKVINSAFFVDEATGQEIIEPIAAVPPLRGPGGKFTLVRATCYTLDGGKTHMAAYYEKFTDDAQAAMQKSESEQQNPATQDILRLGHLVRSPVAGSPWVPFDSDDGRQVVSDYHNKYGANATLFYP